MSRNFELLQRLDRERIDRVRDPRIIKPSARATAASLNLAPRMFDELNKLVQRLFLSGPMTARQVLFTGATPGVGCTFITARTAEVLAAQVDGTVCLVQSGTTLADFTKYLSHASSVAAKENGNGTSLEQLRTNLWAGPVIANSGMPKREQLETRLLELRREFDYVLMDAAPAENPVALAAAGLMDGVVLVLKAGYTRRSAIRTVVEHLESSNAKLLGTVLNQREYPIPDVIYKRLA